MAKDVIWGPLPFISFDWFAVAGPQAGGDAAVASLLDQVMGFVLQTSKSEPHCWPRLGYHTWFHATLVLAPC